MARMNELILAEAIRIASKAVANLDKLMDRHWQTQADKMRADGVPDDQIAGLKDIQDEQLKASRIELASTTFTRTIGILIAAGDKA